LHEIKKHGEVRGRKHLFLQKKKYIGGEKQQLLGGKKWGGSFVAVMEKTNTLV